MTSPRPVPAAETRVELRVGGSRFVATLAPAGSVEEAQAFVARIRAEFPDATHNVPAYVIGHGAAVTAHCQDDGEPSGTAGRPMLAVLQGSGLGDAVVVVTRYFGGSKLGTGGLVRAYGDAVRAVIEAAPVALKVERSVARLSVAYPLFDPLRRTLEALDAEIVEETFAADVSVTLVLPTDRLDELREAVRELSSGSAVVETGWDRGDEGGGGGGGRQRGNR